MARGRWWGTVPVGLLVLVLVGIAAAEDLSAGSQDRNERADAGERGVQEADGDVGVEEGATDMAAAIEQRLADERRQQKERKKLRSSLEGLTAAIDTQTQAGAAVAEAAAGAKATKEPEASARGRVEKDIERQELPFTAVAVEAQRKRVEEMFYHGYDNYMLHAFPKDELMPISCSGRDTLGSYALTLVDSLDALLVFGNKEEFRTQAKWVMETLDFRDIDENVSVFETNIRILGGLLSAHLLAEEQFPGEYPWGCERTLLHIAHEMGDILLVAFDTPTGIPYGTVNLANGGSVPKGESTVTSVAGAGSYSLEFGILSRLVGDPSYENAAKAAARALYEKRSTLDLLGNHINIKTGSWTATDASVAGNMDSFYEYLLKSALLFGDEESAKMFKVTYTAVMEHLFKHPWYVSAAMNTGRVSSVQFEALEGFWPGLQVLAGDTALAADTMHAFHSIWRELGFVPEAYDLQNQKVVRPQYPLRPEMAESLYYLYQATGDDVWLLYGKEMIDSIDARARVECGFAAVENVANGRLRDHMDSFFLSETCKYLYLLFSPGHEIPSSDRFIFTTEGHPLPMRYEWLAGGADHRILGSCVQAPLVQRITGGTFQPRQHHIQKVDDFALFNAALPTSTPKPAPPASTPAPVAQVGGTARPVEVEDVDTRPVEVVVAPIHVTMNLETLDYVIDNELGYMEPLARIVVVHPADEVDYDEHILPLATYGPQEFETVQSLAVVSRPEDACEMPLNRREFDGRIVLVRRGKCDFVVKVRNCQRAGALGVIIVDNVEPSELISMIGDGPDIVIPSLMLEKYFGDRMMELARRGAAGGQQATPEEEGLLLELTQEGIEYARVFLDQQGIQIYDVEQMLHPGGEEELLLELEAVMTVNGYGMDDELEAQVKEVYFSIRAAVEKQVAAATGKKKAATAHLLLAEIFGDFADFGSGEDEFGRGKLQLFGQAQPLVVGKEAVNCIDGKCAPAFGVLPG